MAPFALEPLAPGFARAVSGLQLFEPPSDADLRFLAAQWSECGVLVFRRQAINERELVAWSGHFGTLEIIVREDWQSPATPEVIRISNLKDATGRSLGGLGRGELDWHSDQSYMEHPATGSLLHMVEGPADSAHTYWAHLGRAYDRLPAATRDAVEGLEVLYDYERRQRTYDDEAPMSTALRRATPLVTHPLVHRHPVTGRASLYLDPTAAAGIVGLSDGEGATLLAEVIEHATHPDVVYQHRWEIGDVVMWDNGIVMHRRDAVPPDTPRLLKRTTFRLPPERHAVPRGRVWTGS